MKVITSFIIITLLMNTYIYSQNVDNYIYTPPKAISDGWETNNINSLQIDTSLIHNFFSQIATAKHKLHSVLLIKNKQLIIEEYYDQNTIDKPHASLRLDLQNQTDSHSVQLKEKAIVLIIGV